MVVASSGCVDEQDLPLEWVGAYLDANPPR
jgi:hypothetical protein